MTVKKRIFISNTFIVLISLVLLLGLAGGAVSVFKDEFLSEYSANSKLSDYTVEVQNILADGSKYNGDWNSLNNDLSQYNFNIFVSDTVKTKKGKKGFYSTLRHNEREAIEGLLESGNINKGIYFIENATVVAEPLKYENTDYVIYAVSSLGKDFYMGIGRGMFEFFIIAFIAAGLLCIVILLLCSQFVTKLLIKKILKPVNELDIAAKRVAAGYLTMPINYTKNDEFKNVCDSFDLMQTHLREGMEKNMAYERARREMISGISHDLRTPLTSVKGFIKGVLDGVASTDEKKNQYLNIAYKKACDMDVLLEKLFYFSKLETGNMPFYKKNINIYDYIEDYAEDKKQELNEKNVEFEYNADYAEILCNVDFEQIKRVIDNIIENSIKYSEAEKLCVSINVKSDNDNVTIVVADNGKGIAENKLNSIFELFYRGDESRTNSGSGLGLYVCKYITEAHGGKIWAENNDGLCVYISLPVAKEE